MTTLDAAQPRRWLGSGFWLPDGCLAELREAKARFEAGQQRQAEIDALDTVINLLLGNIAVVNEVLTKMLANVRNALHDAACGANLAELLPQPTNGGLAERKGTKPSGTSAQRTQGMLAFALELLIVAAQIKTPHAVEWLVAEALKAGVSIDPRRVVVWRKKINSDLWRTPARPGRLQAPVEASKVFRQLAAVPQHAVLLQQRNRPDEAMRRAKGILNAMAAAGRR
jgi:hypothetical protein